jgi:hypothetical protein
MVSDALSARPYAMEKWIYQESLLKMTGIPAVVCAERF